MARFTFKFEAVLRHRASLERERQRSLGAALAVMNALKAELSQVEGIVAEATTDLREHHLNGKLDMGFLAAHRRFMLAMQRKALGLAQRMALAQKQVDEARRNLLEAAKGRKIMEKLRERHFESWRVELARKEAIELDEIGTRLAQRTAAHGAAEEQVP